MFYKLYNYRLEFRGAEQDHSGHIHLFNGAKGLDNKGKLAEYRNQKVILMHVLTFQDGFTGLIGKYSDQREVTDYDPAQDVTMQRIVRDNDYPHTPFVCIPKYQMIACAESGSMTAQAAMNRLHQILAHRQNVMFVHYPLRQVDDLRVAVNNLRLTEVNYDVLPVNPHTGDLGRRLDQSRAVDHIKKFRGKLEAEKSDPLQLNGGFLSSIQELQQSGHSRVGYSGYTGDDVEVSLRKPEEPRPLKEDVDREETFDQEDPSLPEMRINFRDRKLEYPLEEDHLEQIVNTMSAFYRAQITSDSANSDENE